MTLRTRLICALSLVFLSLVLLFSFRLSQVPSGLTVDEASIGYNASLVAKTGKGETGRKFSFFFLTVNGADWKQPVTIYSTAALFKIMPASVFSLRLVSVIFAAISGVIIVLLSYNLFGWVGLCAAFLVYASSPLVLIHSHLAQENIAPVLFVSSWLLTLWYFTKSRRSFWLVLSAIFVGLGFYSYKGMRLVVPVQVALSGLYLLILEKDLLGKIRTLGIFSLSLLPFFIIIPYLNTHYAGAVFDTNPQHLKLFYEYLNGYLSYFDLSYLFVKGDTAVLHSTSIHGVFLFPSLLLFVCGLFFRPKKMPFFSLVVASFFLFPLFYGQVDSIHRFSRILCFVPGYILICSAGASYLFSKVSQPYIKILLSLASFLFVIMYADFVQYYWYQYPRITQADFSATTERYYGELARLSKDSGKTAYVDKGIYNGDGENAHFFESAFFGQKLSFWTPGEAVPTHAVLMTNLQDYPGTTRLKTASDSRYFFFEN